MTKRCRVLVLVPAVVTAMVLGTGVAVATVAVKPAARTWGTNGRVMALQPLGDGRVVLGGTFSAVVEPGGATHPAANLAVINPATGAADLTWQGRTDGTVNALALLGGQLFVGGNFSRANGASRADLASLDPATGGLQAWNATANLTVDALTIAGTALYAGGNFTQVNGSARRFAAKLDTATGALDTGWTPSPDARVRALTSSGSTIFLGGDFTRPTNKVAAVSASSGAALSGFKAVANNLSSFATVWDLQTDGTSLYEAVGGGGGACTAVSASTGAKSWSKHSNGNLHAVQRMGSDVYCGGHFSGTGSFDGQTRRKLAAVNASTGVTESFAPVVNSALGVWSLATDGTRLFAGGDFTKVSAVLVSHYAQFS